MSSDQTIDDVRSFWGAEPCGTHFIDRAGDDREFFEQYRRFRYQTEWHIPQLIPFSEARGRQVLEIGCGNGADGVMFAMNGAIYTGVDLTDAAVAATRRHFEVLGLRGAFQVEDAEKLSFPDSRFDLVYSYGVLHHTPNPAAALSEVFRVLKPGGKAIVMLYHKHSLNYYLRIMTYMRLGLLLKVLSRFRRLESDRLRLGERELKGLRGNESSEVWSVHYANFLRQGWSYLKANNFVHHCTDGPECPYAHVFTRSSARRAFADFSRVEFTVAHFPLKKYRFGKRIPHGIESLLASCLGWHLIVWATK